MRVLRFLPSQACLTLSSNSGWPMAAMALLLAVRLAKPGIYVLNPAGREPAAADTRRAVALAGRVAWMNVGLAATALLLFAAWRSA